MRKIALGTIALLVVACTSIDCPVDNLVYTVYDLQKPDGSPDTLGVDTMTIWTHRADGSDTIVANKLCGTTATYVSLYISHTQPEDSFFVLTQDTSGNKWRDTIRILKENYPHFESVDCQAAYFHKITAATATRHIIDTLIINNPNVNYDIKTVHFYLRLKARR